jgi:superfamily I DNA/RNA helicase
MHKDGIAVAEYGTELPPKAELEQKLHAALLEARERLARRGVLWGGAWMTSDETLPRPAAMRRSPSDFDPTSDTIKVITMKVSKGLEFPVMALAGVGRMPAKGEDERDATRATKRLVIGAEGWEIGEQSV